VRASKLPSRRKSKRLSTISMPCRLASRCPFLLAQ
jgi:hypothetical protein